MVSAIRKEAALDLKRRPLFDSMAPSDEAAYTQLYEATPAVRRASARYLSRALAKIFSKPSRYAISYRLADIIADQQPSDSGWHISDVPQNCLMSVAEMLPGCRHSVTLATSNNCFRHFLMLVVGVGTVVSDAIKPGHHAIDVLIEGVINLLEHHSKHRVGAEGVQSTMKCAVGLPIGCDPPFEFGVWQFVCSILERQLLSGVDAIALCLTPVRQPPQRPFDE